MSKSRPIVHLGIPAIALGLLSFYVLAATGVVPFPPQLGLAFFLALGLAGIFGVVAVAYHLDPRGEDLLVRVAVAYGVAAFAIWEAVGVIQQGARPIVGRFVERLGEAAGPEELAAWTIRGAMTVQVTLDVAFDVLYCAAIILLGWRMTHHPDFGRWLGGFGVASGLVLLVLNLWSFPVPPAEAGLIDAGPATGIWWILVIVRMIRVDRRGRSGRGLPVAGGTL